MLDFGFLMPFHCIDYIAWVLPSHTTQFGGVESSAQRGHLGKGTWKKRQEQWIKDCLGLDLATLVNSEFWHFASTGVNIPKMCFRVLGKLLSHGPNINATQIL